MSIMRGFSRVDDRGKISIPTNVRREIGFKPGQLVEVKVMGPVQAQYITVRKRAVVR